jgi:hypothetical protein
MQAIALFVISLDGLMKVSKKMALAGISEKDPNFIKFAIELVELHPLCSHAMKLANELAKEYDPEGYARACAIVDARKYKDAAMKDDPL